MYLLYFLHEITMGIHGLLPFLSKSSRRVNVKEYAGQTVAIDAYCWLHKGVFSCAEKLVMNEPTVLYVTYCFKFINMLLSHNIKPILVFDGRCLPAKAATEKKRRESREINLKKGAELLKIGCNEEGRSYLRRSVDVTHEIALKLIKECRQRNVDCIVAPYEADAQLAYLNIKNIAQVVITEDSDLLLFGCVRVLFKMDINGDGLLIEKDKLHLSMGVRHDSFNMDKFRYMCILSGCDYLPSLPGIGLNKACKFMNRTSEKNIYAALLKLPVNLNMWTLRVTDEYRDNFLKADRAFQFQLVYDPILRKQVPLCETEDTCKIVGEFLEDNDAFQLAIGNLDPMTLEKVDNYDPDMKKVITDRWKKHMVSSHQSIWDKNYRPRVIKTRNCALAVHSSTKGISITTNVSLPLKRPNECILESDMQLTKDYFHNLYLRDTKKSRQTIEAVSEEQKKKCIGKEDNKSIEWSPVLYTKKNPFALRSPPGSSAKKKCLGALARFKLGLENDDLLSSRYFADKEASNGTEPSLLDIIHSTENENKVLNQNKIKINDLKEIKTDLINNESVLSTKSVQDMETEPINKTSIPNKKIDNELNHSSMVIQSKLSKFSLNCSHRTSLLEEEAVDDTIRSSQNENIFKLSSVDSSVDNKEENKNINGRIESYDGYNQYKNVLAPSNRECTVKTFYETRNIEGNQEQVSPYFQKFSKSANHNHSKESESLRNTSVSLMRSTKTQKSKNVLNRPRHGQNQSLLTNFGFQSRPKFQT